MKPTCRYWLNFFTGDVTEGWWELENHYALALWFSNETNLNGLSRGVFSITDRRSGQVGTLLNDSDKFAVTEGWWELENHYALALWFSNETNLNGLSRGVFSITDRRSGQVGTLLNDSDKFAVTEGWWELENHYALALWFSNETNLNGLSRGVFNITDRRSGQVGTLLNDSDKFAETFTEYTLDLGLSWRLGGNPG